MAATGSEKQGAKAYYVDQRVTDAATWGLLPAGATITKGAVLFPRLEEKPSA